MTLRFLFLLLLPVAALRAAPAADPLDRNIERIFGPGREFEAKSFGPARWRDDSRSYTTLEASTAVKGAKEIVRWDAATGQREVVVTAAQLTPPKPDAKPLTIDDYVWSKDERWLLIYTNSQRVWRQKNRGDYWVLEVRTGKLRQLGGNAPAASLMFAKFSPDSTRVAYAHGGNLHVEQLDSGKITQLTRDGSPTLTNGTPDWVNEEELAIRDAFRWSEDGKSIAFYQFDASGVGEFILVNTTAALYPQLTRIPFPKVGTTNSAVRIGVVPARGGTVRWMNLPGDLRQNYVARLSWTTDTHQLVLHRLNRLQNQLDVYLGDARSGELTPFFQDTDAAWVSVREGVQWTRDSRTLLILSDRDGWQRAYAVSRADRSVRALTPAGADAISLVGTDADDTWLYYLASPEDATQRLLYRCRLDGTGTAERITPAAQPGTHSFTLSPDGRYAFHTWSRQAQPAVTTLIRLPGHEVVRPLEENRALRENAAALVRPPEFFKVEAAPGVSLDGWMLKPRDFDPARKYPVILFVYGEAGSVTVTDAWGGQRQLFHFALADAGYIVLSLDNRGTPAPKGRTWRKASHGIGNAVAVEDLPVAMKNLLRQRPYLDAARVGVWGHSGGGANTLNLLFRAPDVFHVGVSTAPVTDTRYYDTIYQERYQGLPSQNENGYRIASPLHFAEGLRGKLLLIHGIADDNVHFQHSELLINRLVELQKQFDLMVYPNGSHSLNEGKGYALHRYRTTARYFQTHLPVSSAPARRSEAP